MPDAERTPLALDQFQAEFAAWADATFPRSTPRSRARHLFREAIELVCATHQGDDPDLLAGQLADDLARELAKERMRGGGDVAEEAADLLLLLLHLAQGSHFSLLAAAQEKYAEVRGRTWGAPDEAGVTEHLREGRDQPELKPSPRRAAARHPSP